MMMPLFSGRACVFRFVTPLLTWSLLKGHPGCKLLPMKTGPWGLSLELSPPKAFFCLPVYCLSLL